MPAGGVTAVGERDLLSTGGPNLDRLLVLPAYDLEGDRVASLLTGVGQPLEAGPDGAGLGDPLPRGER
jgi:hypothetical protein